MERENDMKLFHNGFIGKALILLAALGIAGYFAWSFYPFGYWFGSTFLESIPRSAELFGYLAAAIMAVMVVFGFFYAEYTREDVEAYEAHKGDGSFIKAFREMKWWIVGVEVFSLLFRWYMVHWSFLGIIVIGVGMVLLRLSFVLGKVIHAQANRPYEVIAERAMDQAGRDVVTDGMRYLKKMTVEQKRRFFNGDASVVGEVKDVKENERIANERKRKEREEEVAKIREKSKNVTHQLLKNPFVHAQSNQDQADRLSQNGRQR
jgi:hypothetical protein